MTGPLAGEAIGRQNRCITRMYFIVIDKSKAHGIAARAAPVTHAPLAFQEWLLADPTGSWQREESLVYAQLDRPRVEQSVG